MSEEKPVDSGAIPSHVSRNVARILANKIGLIKEAMDKVVKTRVPRDP